MTLDLRSQGKRLDNALSMLRALEAVLPDMWRAYALRRPDGKGTGSGGRRSPGEHSDSTGDAVASFQDGLHKDMVDVDEAIDGVVGTLAFAHEIVTRAAAILARKAADVPAGQGWCRAHCGHWCPGTSKTDKTVEDRLRSGLCNPCRGFNDRNHITDLAELQRRRRGHFGNCGCEDCQHQAELRFAPKEVH